MIRKSLHKYTDISTVISAHLTNDFFPWWRSLNKAYNAEFKKNVNTHQQLTKLHHHTIGRFKKYKNKFFTTQFSFHHSASPFAFWKT